jgi:hypothetical protein
LRFRPSNPEIYYILFSDISKIYRCRFLFIPSITAIEFDFKFKTLKNLFLDKSPILEMILLLTSKESRCKGASLTSNIETN